MRSAPRLLILSMTIFLVGCVGADRVRYHTELQSVERPNQARSEHGAYSLSTNESSHGPTSVYEDDMMQTTWFFDNTSMYLTVENKRPHRLWLLLGEGDFVLPVAGSTPILRGDMGILDVDADDTSVPDLQVPADDPIIKRADPTFDPPESTSVHLLPATNVDRSSPYLEIEEMLRPTGPKADSAAVHENLGTRFSIRLPIETRTAVWDYRFRFKVVGAKIPREDQDDQVIGRYPGTDQNKNKTESESQ